MWKLASPKERARVAEEYRKELEKKKEAKPAAADVAATPFVFSPITLFMMSWSGGHGYKAPVAGSCCLSCP